MVKFKEDLFITMYPQMKALNEAHWEEVGGLGELDVDMDMYLMLQSQGILVMVAAYDDDKLIGYVSLSKSKHPHHKDKIFASTDAFYVAPEYRGVTGTKLIKYTEKLLKDKHNVDYFTLAINENFNVGPWAERMGYKQSDILYSKKLED